MLKLKKALLALMVAAAAVCFISCNSDDDEDDTPKAVASNLSAIYGNSYKGSPSAMPAAVISLKVTDADKLTASGVVGGTTMFSVTDKSYTVTKLGSVYTVVTTTDADAALTFNLTINSDDTVDFTYTTMGVTANLSHVYSVSDFYGTYTGNWTVMGNTYATTVIVAENTLYYGSDKMTGSYEHVWWTTDSDGNNVCNGNHVTDSTSSTYETAATTVTVKAVSGTKTGSFSVVAMASLGDPATVTYSSSETLIPLASEVSYTEDAAGAIKSADFASDMATINASDNSSLTVKLTKTASNTFTVSVPDVSGAYGTTTMTIVGFDITGVTVAKNSAGTGYTLAIGTYSEGSVDAVNASSTSIYTCTGTVDGASKTWTVYGLEGTVVNGVLTLKLDYKYGVMPFHSRVTFTAHAE